MPKPTPRQRLFTDEYKIGDRVAIIREKHGWHDGGVIGNIVDMTPNQAKVRDDDGITYIIIHPRDIYKIPKWQEP